MNWLNSYFIYYCFARLDISGYLTKKKVNFKNTVHQEKFLYLCLRNKISPSFWDIVA